MSSTISKYLVLIDDGESQFDLTYSRESEAWAEFWKQVSQMADDGKAVGGFDANHVLASRTGLSPTDSPEAGRRWYVHLTRRTA